jgi:probable HAF family extracellular repeat protein
VVGAGATTVPVAPFLVLNEAYFYSNGKTVNLDGRQGGQSSAFGINDAGQITGSKSTGTCTSTFGGCQSGAGLGDTHAFLNTGSGLTDIGTLGGNFSEGRGINNRGEITGGSNLVAGGPNHVFLYRRGSMHDLGFVGEGTAINDDSQIVGTGAEGGFLYRDGAFHLLPLLPGGTYTTPTGVNNHGDVVGTADFPGPANAPTHAFLYRGGKTVDLNALVDSSLTLLISASGINDKGQIVAAGLNGQLYVLTPRQ